MTTTTLATKLTRVAALVNTVDVYDNETLVKSVIVGDLYTLSQLAAPAAAPTLQQQLESWNMRSTR